MASASESTKFNIDDFSSETQDLFLEGDAHIPPGESFLRLTKTDDSKKPEMSSLGSVFYAHPVLFKDASTGKKLKLTTTIVFSITEGHPGPADGIAFFISRSLDLSKGSCGGNFGIFDPESGTASGIFAVEIDMFPNEWDPPSPHIGIDIESRVSSVCTEFDTSLTGREVTAVITYDETTHFINVQVTVGEKTYNCYYTYDLSRIVGNKVYVGISSATGALVALHDIHSWSFQSSMDSDD